MNYQTPTSDEFRVKFPEFADLSDEQIDALILEANRSVDTTWFEADYSNAILYLAAHYQQITENAAANAASSGDNPGGQTVTAEHIGPISVSYGKTITAASNASISTSSLSSTPYGQRYYDLLIKNIPAVLVV